LRPGDLDPDADLFLRNNKDPKSPRFREGKRMGAMVIACARREPRVRAENLQIAKSQKICYTCRANRYKGIRLGVAATGGR